MPRRYTLTTHGGTATYRLGNADGTLAIVSRFRSVDGQWRPVTATRCVGASGSALVPAPRLETLGRHGFTPWPTTAFFGRSTYGAVLVDDRAHYDPAGLVRHLSVYAEPCGHDICCLVSGTGLLRDPSRPAGSLRGRVRANIPQDRSLFLTDDSLPRRHQPYRLWGLTASTGFSARLANGTVIEAQRFMGPGWPTPLYLVLARRGQVVRFTLPSAHGTLTIKPDQVP